MPRFKKDKEPTTENEEIKEGLKTMQDIKSINKRLAAAKENHEQKIKALNDEKAKYAAEIVKYEAILKEPKDATEYQNAFDIVNKAKRQIEFCDIQLSKLKTVINPDDYEGALKELNAAFDAFIFENRETLKAEIEALLNDYFSYYEGFSEYNSALCDLNFLAGAPDNRRFVDSEIYKDETISGTVKRVFEFLHLEKCHIDTRDIICFQAEVKKA